MELGGSAEVAALLGVSRQRLSTIRSQPGFPDPLQELAAGPVWDLEQIQRWMGSGLRRSGGRPRQDENREVVGDRYLLDPAPLGSGGFADVYRATDLTVSSRGKDPAVAVKILRDFHDEEALKRFQRELRIVSQYRHPHIMRILDNGVMENGSVWFAMPLAKGSLLDEIDQFPGNDDRILRLMRQVCDGLIHVHANGVFHRDLKPANILRTGTDSWALADFGLAREEERTSTALTSTAQFVGTYMYAAPETWNAKYAEAPADIYSIGKILQHLVTGELPVGYEPPAGRFRTVIDRCLRQKPADRFPSVEAVLDAVESAAAAPTRWKQLDQEVDRLVDGVSAELPDESAVLELGRVIVDAADRHKTIETLQQVIPRMSFAAIEILWDQDRADFRQIVDEYGRFVRTSGFSFSFCDVIANFLSRCVQVTNDPQVLQASIWSLCELGESHNRFHVRTVAVGILQEITETEHALAAAQAIRDADGVSVEWTINEFVEKSLHPTIRDAVRSCRITP